MSRPVDRRRGDAWYAQPVVWLGIAVLVASITGCLWLIVVSARHDDSRLPTGREVFGVPVRPASPPDAPP
ncbi:MAG: hypothetical protein IPI06_01410 [Gammaproteobacteria bacterium]|nr:hypothetical protein [Gammaproteobacteria bacterium]